MKKIYLLLVVIATPVVLFLMSNSAGSIGGKSGSIGDNGSTCTDCHGGTATPMTGWITTTVPPEGYTPGQTYTITATGTHSGVVKFGFELTVEDSQGNKVGTLVITDAARTHFTNSNHAVTHTSAGNIPNGNTNTWSMNWIAPTNVNGNIGIYAAFNAANGNGNTSGDIIYKSSTFISKVAPPPVLVSIVPNQAEQGDTFQATITGSNTDFNGSPDVSMSYSNNGFEVINATSVVVVNATTLQAQFTIPVDASAGLWDVHVDDLDLDDSFTVLEAVPAIQFMEPNFAHQGDAFNGTIFGENTNWSGTPVVTLSHVNNPAIIITATNVTVVNATELTADFSIPGDVQTGNYNVNVDALTQSNGFTVLAALQPVLTEIVPDNGAQGSMVTTTINAENTNFGESDPAVSLSLHSNPAETITASSVTVVDNNTLQASFDLPFDATPGLWDLNVDELVLINSFTIIEVVPALESITPESAVQGDVVTTTIKAVNSHFTLTEPVIQLLYSGNPQEVIQTTSINVINDVTVEAVFTIPSNATTGLWDLTVDGMTLEDAFTVNLFIGIATNTMTDVQVYPNPADERFFIDGATGSDLSVYSAGGKLMFRMDGLSEKQQIDVSGLTRGLYLVKIKSGGSERIEKLLVN